MIIRDCVLDLQRYWSPYGSVAPPADWPDVSRFRVAGAVTTATWAQLPSGLWTMDFDSATPDYVTIPAADTQLDFTSGDFSIVARLYIDDLSAVRTILTRQNGLQNGYRFHVNNNGRLYLYTFQAAISQASASPLAGIVAGQWYTCGVSRVGVSARIYTDGVDTTAIVGVHVDPTTSPGNALIGVRSDLASAPFDGSLSALKVFSYALTPDQQMQQHISLSNNWE